MPLPSGKVWAEINTSAWRDNFTAISGHMAPLTVMPVVKANAYGMGAREMAAALRDCGTTHLAVSCLREGLELRDFGMEILILGASLQDEIPEIIHAGLIPSVQDLTMAQALSDAAVAFNCTVRIHIKVDTGMGRFGVALAEAPDMIRAVAGMPNLELHGIFSHLAVSRGEDPRTQAAVRALADLIAGMKDEGIEFRYRHIANSTAIAGMPEACQEPFNMVRSGIDLQGGHVGVVPRPYATRPVLSLTARLIAVRELPCEATVGYGRTYRVEKETERIGVVSIGYADGYPRYLSNRGTMLVRGKRCPVRGLVCMDYTMVSLEEVPEAKVGDEVVVIGNQGEECISISEVARAAETIPYELMCGLGSRVQRRYVTA